MTQDSGQNRDANSFHLQWHHGARGDLTSNITRNHVSTVMTARRDRGTRTTREKTS